MEKINKKYVDSNSENNLWETLNQVHLHKKTLQNKIDIAEEDIILIMKIKKNADSIEDFISFKIFLDKEMTMKILFIEHLV